MLSSGDCAIEVSRLRRLCAVSGGGASLGGAEEVERSGRAACRRAPANSSQDWNRCSRSLAIAL